MRSLLVVLILVFQVQACNASFEMLKPPEPAQPMSSKVPHGHTAEQSVELVAGIDMLSHFAKFKVKNPKGSEMVFDKAIDRKNNTIIAVIKPGCIYCESMMAVLKGTKLKSKAKMIFVLDAAHASEVEFRQKVKDSNQVRGVWYYDAENKFFEIFGIGSFPQILIIDKKGKLIKYQKGLVLPKNTEQFNTMEFAVVLQTLARSTVTWLEQY